MNIDSLATHIMTQKVSDLHLNESCFKCSPAESIRAVAELLVQKKIGSVIIVDPEYPSPRPLGIFTERDLVRCVGNRNLDLSKEPVSHQMTPNPKTVYLESTLHTVMATMRIGRFRHLVIINHSGEVTGVLSIRDVMNHLMDELSSVS